MKIPLFFQKRFFPLWLAFSLGAFNDNMLRQSLIIGIGYGAVAMTGFEDPKNAIPFVGALFAIAALTCTSIAGQVAEKYETSFLFRRIKFFEVILMALAALGFALKSGIFLMLVLIAMSAQTAFFSPVRIAAMPKYLHTDELIKGNAYCNAGMFVSVVAGLFLGGILIAGPGGGGAVSAFLFTAALITWIGVLFSPKAAPDAPDLKIDWNPFRQTVSIVAHAFTEPGVWRPLLGVSMFYVVSTITTILVPLYAIDELGADGAAATSIMGLFAIGAGFGAIASASLSKRRSGLGFSCLGIVGAGLMTFFLYWMTDFVAATGRTATVGDLLGHTPGMLLIAGFWLSSASMGLYLVPMQAAMQRRAPATTRARIMAAGNLLNAAAAVGGSLCVIIITSTRLTPADGFLMISGLQFVIALYMALRWRTAPGGLYDDALISRPNPEQVR